jgi:hypothetical protein
VLLASLPAASFASLLSAVPESFTLPRVVSTFAAARLASESVPPCRRDGAD